MTTTFSDINEIVIPTTFSELTPTDFAGERNGLCLQGNLEIDFKGFVNEADSFIFY